MSELRKCVVMGVADVGLLVGVGAAREHVIAWLWWFFMVVMVVCVLMDFAIFYRRGRADGMQVLVESFFARFPMVETVLYPSSNESQDEGFHPVAGEDSRRPGESLNEKK